MYIINGIEFQTKKEVKEYTKKILADTHEGEILGNEFEFLKELVVNYYPHPNKKDNIIKLYVKYINERHILHMVLKNKDKTLEDMGLNRTIVISITRIIDNLPNSEVTLENFIIPLGKYKGRNLKDVYDVRYLKWLYNYLSNKQQLSCVWKQIQLHDRNAF